MQDRGEKPGDRVGLMTEIKQIIVGVDGSEAVELLCVGPTTRLHTMAHPSTPSWSGMRRRCR